ncbi:alpha/beta hydrolase fold domain-containing protein [Clostridium tertium]|uniref:Acetyl esterase n=1 Tax=Clostridium tertium TaxID=1559 RepID=A0A6N3AAR6_9CLOT
MKKFFKILGVIILLLIISLGVFAFIIRDKISLTINIVKKYSNIIENPSTITENDLSLEAVKDIDYKDVEYKNTNGISQTLDIYGPKKELKGGSPVLLYVHGGSWVYGSKDIPEAISPLLDAFREEGFTIISTSYQLMREEENFYKQISDVKDTVRWIYKNKEKYNFKTDDIGLLGASSGAHLSLMAAYSNNNEFIDEEDLKDYPSDVKYLIDFFGPTDLTTLDMDNVNWDLEQIINSVGSNKEEILSKYSPINYVNENEPKTLIIHSRKDTTVPYENAERLYDELESKNNKVKIIALEGATHDFSEFNMEEIMKVGLKMLQFIIQNI